MFLSSSSVEFLLRGAALATIIASPTHSLSHIIRLERSKFAVVRHSGFYLSRNLFL